MSDQEDAETGGRGDAERGQEPAGLTEGASVVATPTPTALPVEVAPAHEEKPVAASATPEGALAEVPPPSPVDRQGEEQPPAAAPEPEGPAEDRRKSPRGPRPSLSEARDPVFHEAEGYRLRLEPPDLAKLRELPGAKGKTDKELGEQFFNGQSPRLVASIAGDVETPAEVRVVVDPYSRQAFLAVGRTIRGIVSF